MPKNLVDLEGLLNQQLKLRQLEKTQGNQEAVKVLTLNIKSLWRKRYELNNPDKIKANRTVNNLRQTATGYKKLKAAEARAKDPDRSKENYKRYYLNNLKRIRLLKAAYKKELHAKNPSAHLAANMRRRINAALKSNNCEKNTKTNVLLGCSYSFLKTYIEARFTEGMDWNNYGAWHVDHIIPCDVFDLCDEKQQRLCFHYTNLQPLWACDNLTKSNKIILNDKTYLTNE